MFYNAIDVVILFHEGYWPFITNTYMGSQSEEAAEQCDSNPMFEDHQLEGQLWVQNIAFLASSICFLYKIHSKYLNVLY